MVGIRRVSGACGGTRLHGLGGCVDVLWHARGAIFRTGACSGPDWLRHHEPSGVSSGAGLPATTRKHRRITMSWKEQLDKAVAQIKGAAESEKAREISGKAKATALSLLEKVKVGAVGAAEAFLEANRDPSSLEVHFLNAHLTVLSPSEGVTVTRPDAASLVVSDGEGNGLVINAAADPAFIVEQIGTVLQVSGNTYDLGAEDGRNLIVTKF
jgi:hypothetical protein